jgi:hypothetical protein
MKPITLETDEDDTIFIVSENITLCIKHNDVGISLDIYDRESDQPVREMQYWFEDFTLEPKE